MELLAQNSCRLTRELYQETLRRSIKAWYKWLCLILSGILIVAAAILAGLDIALGELSSLWQPVLFLSIGLFTVLWVMELYPRLVAGRGYRQLLAMNGGKPLERTTFFYGKKLKIQTDNGNASMITYDKIEQITRTEHLLIVEFQDNMVLLLDRAGFTLGSEESIQRLIGKRIQ